MEQLGIPNAYITYNTYHVYIYIYVYIYIIYIVYIYIVYIYSIYIYTHNYIVFLVSPKKDRTVMNIIIYHNLI